MENPTVTEGAADDIPDDIDENVEFWARLIPELDTETEAIVQRISDIAHYLRKSMEETVSEHGISWGEWKLLNDLRRREPDYRSTPGKLASKLGLSSGAMTNRLDRLESEELIRRLPDPDDRRSVVVELTDEGLRRWQEAVGRQAVHESTVAASLDAREKQQLNAYLRRLLAGVRPEGKEGKGT